jgi:hypothetical protein
MQPVFKGKYEVVNEDLSHPMKIVAKGRYNSFGMKKNVRSPASHLKWTGSRDGYHTIKEKCGLIME